MNFDFVFKKGNDEFNIMSFLLQGKMKVFSESNPRFIKNRCNRSWVDGSGNTIHEYEIETDASKEIINNFIQFSMQGVIPENFNPEDIDIYLQLAKEFEHKEFKNQIITQYKCLSKVLNRYCSNQDKIFGNKENDEITIVNDIDTCFTDEKCRSIIIEQFSINQLHRIIEKLQDKRQSEPNFEEKLFDLLNERINKNKMENKCDDTALLLQYLDPSKLCEESKEKLISITDEYGIIVPKLITDLHRQSKQHSIEIQRIQEHQKELEKLILQQQATIEQLNARNEEMLQLIQTMQNDNQERNKYNSQIQNAINEIKNELNEKSLSINQINQDNQERRRILTKIQEIDPFLTSNIGELLKENIISFVSTINSSKY